MNTIMMKSRKLISILAAVLAVTAVADDEAKVKAKFITALAADGSPVARFRKAFEVKEVPASAPLEITSLGCFRAYLNGKPVGNDFLAPGYTQVDARRLTLSYECAPLLQPGTNVLAVEVSCAWWSDAITKGAFTFVGGAKGVRCKLQDVETDGTWQAKFGGPVQRCGIYEGEEFDARKDDRAWMTEPVSDWPCAAVIEGNIYLTPDRGSVPRIRDDLELRPVAMRILGDKAVGAAADRYGTAVVKAEGVKETVTVRPGETLVVDFGQNHAGVPSFTVEGPRGAELAVKFVEMLNDEGGLRSRGCDGPGGTPYVTALRGTTAHVRYVSDGTRRLYRPANTFFGYRYAAFTVTDPMTLSGIRAHVVTSVRRDTGRIVTGDRSVNRLISNCVWGMYSNYLSIPTDCPQRNERLGWTGDTQVFSRTACYAADAKGFLSKWLDDLCDFQREDGAYPDLAPIGSWDKKYCWYGITGWADAGIIVPYNLWQMYGDLEPVRRHWKSMLRYADFLEKNKGPADCFGDWLAFERNDADLKRIMSASYWVWDMSLMREMAAALGEADDVQRFTALERTARENYAANYLDEKGEIKAKYRSQTADLLALKLKLLPDEKAFAATKADLLANLRRHGNRLQTGFLGTSVLMDTLSDIGEREMAVTLLLQRENPSWLYSVDQGATTIWERWDSWTKEKGFGSAGMNSFNHYSYGAVLGWMYAHLAGIRPDPAKPGFRHFILAPEPDARLGSCDATYDSVAGRIRSKWEYVDGKAKFTFAVPEGTTATAILPDGRTFELKPGEATF